MESMDHVVWEFLGSATVIGIVGHAVNTFPPPTNVYGRWALSLVQWIVGQRTQAAATRSGTGNGTNGGSN